jgi:hypothetical protein
VVFYFPQQHIPHFHPQLCPLPEGLLPFRFLAISGVTGSKASRPDKSTVPIGVLSGYVYFLPTFFEIF